MTRKRSKKSNTKELIPAQKANGLMFCLSPPGTLKKLYSAHLVCQIVVWRLYDLLLEARIRVFKRHLIRTRVEIPRAVISYLQLRVQKRRSLAPKYFRRWLKNAIRAKLMRKYWLRWYQFAMSRISIKLCQLLSIWMPGTLHMLNSTRRNLITKVVEGNRHLLPKFKSITDRMEKQIDIFSTISLDFNAEKRAETIFVATRGMRNEMKNMLKNNLKLLAELSDGINCWESIIFNYITYNIVYSRAFNLLIIYYPVIMTFWEHWREKKIDEPQKLTNFFKSVHRFLKMKGEKLDPLEAHQMLVAYTTKTPIDTREHPCNKCKKKYIMHNYVRGNIITNKCKSCFTSADGDEYGTIVALEEIFGASIKMHMPQ